MQYNGTGKNSGAQKCKPKGAFADRNDIICYKQDSCINCSIPVQPYSKSDIQLFQ